MQVTQQKRLQNCVGGAATADMRAGEWRIVFADCFAVSHLADAILDHPPQHGRVARPVRNRGVRLQRGPSICAARLGFTLHLRKVKKTKTQPAGLLCTSVRSSTRRRQLRHDVATGALDLQTVLNREHQKAYQSVLRYDQHAWLTDEM